MTVLESLTTELGGMGAIGISLARSAKRCEREAVRVGGYDRVRRTSNRQRD